MSRRAAWAAGPLSNIQLTWPVIPSRNERSSSGTGDDERLDPDSMDPEAQRRYEHQPPVGTSADSHPVSYTPGVRPSSFRGGSWPDDNDHQMASQFLQESRSPRGSASSGVATSVFVGGGGGEGAGFSPGTRGAGFADFVPPDATGMASAQGGTTQILYSQQGFQGGNPNIAAGRQPHSVQTSTQTQGFEYPLDPQQQQGQHPGATGTQFNGVTGNQFPTQGAPPPYSPAMIQEWIQQQIQTSLDQMGLQDRQHFQNQQAAYQPATPYQPARPYQPAVAYQPAMAAAGPDPDDPAMEDEAETRRKAKKAFTQKRCILVDNGVPSIHLGKAVVTFEDKAKRMKKVEIGRPKMGAQEKVIMVVGATGSGKTTLINGMFNYVVGIEWTDDFRLKLVQEIASGQVANQAKSQTNWITSYTIHHKTGFTVPYTLTIIDTPGFGDTEGIQRDKAITEQIRTFFTTRGCNGVDMLDAVGFVAQSSLPRLTPTQRYIFDSILSLFGKDIADNIFMLLTFADGQKPQVLSGIKEAKMPYQKFFKFNNSALYVNNRNTDDDDDENFDEMFWKMGVKSFRVFMTELGRVQPKSLLLTKDVLNERQRLEVTIEGIQKDIKVGLNKLEQLQKEVQVLKNHQADIDKNKNFHYEVNEQSVETQPTNPGQYTTNCITCNMTCHKTCAFSNDEDKERCVAMTNGNCHVCPEKCHWTMHKNQPYVYVIKTQKVKKTADDLKRRYEEAEGKKLSAEEIIQKCAEEFEAVQMKIISLTEVARKSIEKLNAIALRPNPLSTVDYIDVLINSEQAEARPGWKKRVQQLQDVRSKAEHMQRLAANGFDPFEEYRRRYDEERRQNKDGPWTTAMKYLKRGFSST